MDFAAVAPEAMASITELGPVTQSPPPNTPGIFDFNELETDSAPLFVRAAFSGMKSSDIDWPMAIITESHAITCSEPSLGTGRLLPLASTSPRIMVTHSRPETLPSSPMTRVGLESSTISMPSSNVWFASSMVAGISCLVRRYSTVTLSAPSLIDVLAASSATFPPPTTITWPFNEVILRWYTSQSMSMALKTPSRSSPGMFIEFEACAPTDTKTASCFFLSGSQSSRDISTPVLNSTPMSCMYLSSSSRVDSGRRYLGI